MEVAFLPDGWVGLRDTEDPENPPFVIDPHAWRAFIDGAKKGEFDLPSA